MHYSLKAPAVDEGIRPDFTVICEPSANVITTGHKGKAQLIIRSEGVSAHGSAPEKGVNAVYEMAGIIQCIEQLNLELMRKPGRHGTLVLSRISSSSVSLNAVPYACEVYLDRRMVVGETEATVRSEMEGLVAGKRATWRVGTLQETTWTGEQLTMSRSIRPGRSALNARWPGLSIRLTVRFMAMRHSVTIIGISAQTPWLLWQRAFR